MAAPQQISWLEPGLVFYILASAIIGRVIENTRAPAENCIIVLPGSRAPLVLQKMHSNPNLKQQIVDYQRGLQSKLPQIFTDIEKSLDEFIDILNQSRSGYFC